MVAATARLDRPDGLLAVGRDEAGVGREAREARAPRHAVGRGRPGPAEGDDRGVRSGRRVPTGKPSGEGLADLAGGREVALPERPGRRRHRGVEAVERDRHAGA